MGRKMEGGTERRIREAAGEVERQRVESEVRLTLKGYRRNG